PAVAAAHYGGAAAWAAHSSGAGHRIDILDGARQRHRRPARTAIPRAEDLALIAGADIDLGRVSGAEPDGHDRAVHLHPVKTRPAAAGVLAAIDPALVAGCRGAQRRVNGMGVLRRNLHVATVADRGEALYLHVLPVRALVGGAKQPHAAGQDQ